MWASLSTTTVQTCHHMEGNEIANTNDLKHLPISE
jgi:hypothetical protein